MSNFWSNWIIVLTMITLVAITWILLANQKRDDNSAETTGHIYDGIEEYDNPLPAWWFWMFVITIVWGVGYLIFYPGMGNYQGVLGWSQHSEHDQAVATAELKYQEIRESYLSRSVGEIAADPAVHRMGQRLFGNHCAQCHGSDGRGSYGFPDLTDSDWIWGGDVKDIKNTLINGRQAVMPAWQGVLGDQGLEEMTEYILSLNKQAQTTPSLISSSENFVMYCGGCHQPDGTGNQMIGAPNLTDDVWLYGGSKSEIAQTLRYGRTGMMPAQNTILSEAKLHILTAYVTSLRFEDKN